MRQYSPLEFEYIYSKSATTIEIDPDTGGPKYPTTCMAKISEVDVAVANSSGGIISARPTYLPDELVLPTFYRGKGGSGGPLTDGAFEASTYSNPLSMMAYGDFVYILHAQRIMVANKHKKSVRDVGIPLTPTQIANNTVFFEQEIALPSSLAVGSPIYVAYNKIWIVSTELTTELNNKLYSYDLTTQNWSSVSIPGRHQFIERRISDDFDGNIIITNMNDHSVVIMNAATSAHVKTIKVNRHTYGLSRNENKVLYVMSDKQNQELVSTTKTDANLVNSSGANAGLFVLETPSGEQTSVLSTLNIAAGTATPVGTAMGLDYVLDDLRTGYRWCVGSPVGWRILTTSSSSTARDDTTALSEQFGITLKYQSEVEKPANLPSSPQTGNPKLYDTYFCTEDEQLYCWMYSSSVRIKSATNAADEALGIDGIQGVLTSQFTYDKYDPVTDTTTSYTERPFLFIRTRDSVYAYRLTSLVGVNSSEVLATAMIAVGPQAYIGD